MRTDILHLFEARKRFMAGVMSGTSVDGIDVALVHLDGSGKDLQLELTAIQSFPFEGALMAEILRASDPDRSSNQLIARTNVLLANAYAEAIRITASSAGIPFDDIEVVGLHGQTVYHQGEPSEFAGRSLAATLQIGDPSVLANLLGLPVVGDFRQADMALGGQGAPLVPYFDYVMFGDETESRILLNLGGIANLTLLPAGCDFSDVVAFDTGPANMVIDQLCKKLFQRPFDEGGAFALKGRSDADWLDELLQHPFFGERPPKSTGRELFSSQYVEELIEAGKARGLNREDVLATATGLTVAAIKRAVEQFADDPDSFEKIVAAGGGVHNLAMMQGLNRAFDAASLVTTESYGIPPEAKEAICFAVLAHETLNGVPTNLPSVTGASSPTLLGKICIPG